MDHIQSWGIWSPLLILFTVILITGGGVRAVGGTVAVAMVWFAVSRTDLDASLVVNLNAFKREFAFIAAGALLAVYGGGSRFTLLDIHDRVRLAMALFRARHGNGRRIPYPE